jgi:hypothetical protein
MPVEFHKDAYRWELPEAPFVLSALASLAMEKTLLPEPADGFVIPYTVKTDEETKSFGILQRTLSGVATRLRHILDSADINVHLVRDHQMSKLCSLPEWELHLWMLCVRAVLRRYLKASSRDGKPYIVVSTPDGCSYVAQDWQNCLSGGPSKALPEMLMLASVLLFEHRTLNYRYPSRVDGGCLFRLLPYDRGVIACSNELLSIRSILKPTAKPLERDYSSFLEGQDALAAALAGAEALVFARD